MTVLIWCLSLYQPFMLWFLRLKWSLACASRGPQCYVVLPFPAEAALVVTVLVRVYVPLEVLM